jgi:hypothetical protein
MSSDAAPKTENQDAVAEVLASEKVNGSSCSTSKCPFSSPKLMAFALPFFAVLALEQWATTSNTCLTVTFGQMGVLLKAALALAAGLVGLAGQRFLAKR